MSWRQNTLFSQRDCGPPGCSSPTEGSSMTWERGQHPFSRDISVQDARANSLVVCLLSAESILFTKCFPMCDQQHDDIHLEMVVPSECPSPSAPLPPNFCSNITFSGRPVPPPCENCNLSTSERSSSFLASSFLAPFLHGFFCSPMQQPWAYPLQTSHSRQHSQGPASKFITALALRPSTGGSRPVTQDHKETMGLLKSSFGLRTLRWPLANQDASNNLSPYPGADLQKAPGLYQAFSGSPPIFPHTGISSKELLTCPVLILAFASQKTRLTRYSIYLLIH